MRAENASTECPNGDSDGPNTEHIFIAEFACYFRVSGVTIGSGSIKLFATQVQLTPNLAKSPDQLATRIIDFRDIISVSRVDKWGVFSLGVTFLTRSDYYDVSLFVGSAESAYCTMRDLWINTHCLVPQEDLDEDGLLEYSGLPSVLPSCPPIVLPGHSTREEDHVPPVSSVILAGWLGRRGRIMPIWTKYFCRLTPLVLSVFASESSADPLTVIPIQSMRGCVVQDDTGEQKEHIMRLFTSEAQFLFSAAQPTERTQWVGALRQLIGTTPGTASWAVTVLRQSTQGIHHQQILQVDEGDRTVNLIASGQIVTAFHFAALHSVEARSTAALGIRIQAHPLLKDSELQRGLDGDSGRGVESGGGTIDILLQTPQDFARLRAVMEGILAHKNEFTFDREFRRELQPSFQSHVDHSTPTSPTQSRWLTLTLRGTLVLRPNQDPSQSPILARSVVGCDTAESGDCELSLSWEREPETITLTFPSSGERVQFMSNLVRANDEALAQPVHSITVDHVRDSIDYISQSPMMVSLQILSLRDLAARTIETRPAGTLPHVPMLSLDCIEAAKRAAMTLKYEVSDREERPDTRREIEYQIEAQRIANVLAGSTPTSLTTASSGELRSGVGNGWPQSSSASDGVPTPPTASLAYQNGSIPPGVQVQRMSRQKSSGKNSGSHWSSIAGLSFRKRLARAQLPKHSQSAPAIGDPSNYSKPISFHKTSKGRACVVNGAVRKVHLGSEDPYMAGATLL